MNDNLIKKAVATTKEIFLQKYADAEVIFLAGSIIRGEETRTSDLDLVVMYEKLPNAFRESFYFNDFPVEAFVHNEETISHFLQNEYENAYSPLMGMILEGIEIPSQCKMSQNLKTFAAELKERKPPTFTGEEIENFRYSITGFIDDIRYPRSKEELTASGAEIYSLLSDFYFRSNNLWLAKDKSIPRRLENADVEFKRGFCLAFEDLFVNGKSEKVINLAKNLLQPYGGFLFEDYRSDAPKTAKCA